MLGQLNHIAVKVSIASASTPRLRSRFVNNASTCTHCCRMGTVNVVDRQGDLSSRGRSPLRRIEGEVEVSPFSPGDLCVSSTYPPVVNAVVARMEIDAECVAVEGRRTVEVRNLQDDRHQPPPVWSQLRSLPGPSRKTLCPRTEPGMVPNDRPVSAKRRSAIVVPDPLPATG
jgi:hypothetical protein